MRGRRWITILRDSSRYAAEPSIPHVASVGQLWRYVVGLGECCVLFTRRGAIIMTNKSAQTQSAPGLFLTAVFHIYYRAGA